MTQVTVIVMAKECVRGHVKTRMHPPFSLEEAARIAQASLDDTMASLLQVDAHRVLCVQGLLAPVQGFTQIPQTTGGLDARIADVLDTVQGRVLLIGMDTPQLDTRLLQALAKGWPTNMDACFGAATDGGFWLLGLDAQERLEPRLEGGLTRGDLVRGVPMSQPDTGEQQRSRLSAAGLRILDLPELTDIDDAASLLQVSQHLAPGSHLLSVLSELETWTTLTRYLTSAAESVA
ncbi:DUF2064 domain-containing protein [Leucobacter viscericola]|uniref:DUF2064 domain-containing protein n=1 Tax=Leucobacter viscericola TaxID=2714935 RepID=A0A6G7XF26_9MICO|nr:DUF2064 domain-containing protein [Leucobacter viscericola]QIK63165.1 DUF2064 domain-containing protein [Leucobacter viscericola]